MEILMKFFYGVMLFTFIIGLYYFQDWLSFGARDEKWYRYGAIPSCITWFGISLILFSFLYVIK